MCVCVCGLKRSRVERTTYYGENARYTCVRQTLRSAELEPVREDVYQQCIYLPVRFGVSQKGKQPARQGQPRLPVVGGP